MAGSTLLMLVACGGSSSTEGVAKAHPPSVSNLVYTPSVVYEGSHGGTAAVTVSIQFSDAGGDLNHSELTVRDPQAQVVQSVCNPAGDFSGLPSGTLMGQVAVPTRLAGEYSVQVGVEDCCAAMSNLLTGTIRVAPYPYRSGTRMPTPRQWSATAVVDGTFYVLGGTGGSGQVLASAEAFDASTHTWTAKAPMAYPRENPAVGVIHGKVYVAGGRPSGEAEVYDPATNVWSPIAPMPTARLNAAGCVWGGKFFVLGGHQGVALSAVEVYDPVTNAWTTATPLPSPRSFATATPFRGRIYVIGGHEGVLNPWLKTVDIYDPGAGTWTAGPALPVGLTQHTALALNDQLVVFGGAHMMTVVSVYRLDPLRELWTAGAPLPRVMGASGATHSGHGYLFDGAGTFEYDPVLDLGPLD